MTNKTAEEILDYNDIVVQVGDIISEYSNFYEVVEHEGILKGKALGAYPPIYLQNHYGGFEIIGMTLKKSQQRLESYRSSAPRWGGIRGKYEQWCKETRRNGKILIGSMWEFFDYLDESGASEGKDARQIAEDAWDAALLWKKRIDYDGNDECQAPDKETYLNNLK
jgi:hypothetical protein